MSFKIQRGGVGTTRPVHGPVRRLPGRRRQLAAPPLVAAGDRFRAAGAARGASAAKAASMPDKLSDAEK